MGRCGNNFTFFAEDFRCLPRSVDEGISAIFRGGAKAGGEKTCQEWEVIYASALSRLRRDNVVNRTSPSGDIIFQQ